MPDAVLYSFRRCPYAMRARLALVVSGMICELREVRLSAKPEAMISASAKGTVPVLVLPSDTVIDQSIDIMRFVLRQRDPERWLERDDHDLIARNDGAFKHHLDRYKYPERYNGNPQAHRDEGLMFLRDLDGLLAGSGQLSGSSRGLTDAAVFPFVRQFAAVDRAWFDTQALPHLHTWFSGHLESRLFAAIMERAAPWAPGDAPVRLWGTQPDVS